MIKSKIRLYPGVFLLPSGRFRISYARISSMFDTIEEALDALDYLKEICKKISNHSQRLATFRKKYPVRREIYLRKTPKKNPHKWVKTIYFLKTRQVAKCEHCGRWATLAVIYTPYGVPKYKIVRHDGLKEIMDNRFLVKPDTLYVLDNPDDLSTIKPFKPTKKRFQWLFK